MTDSRDLQKSLTVALKEGLTVFILLVISSLIHLLPGTETALPIAGIAIVTWMRTGLAVVILILLVTLYPHLNYLLDFYVRNIFWKRRGQEVFDSSINQVTGTALFFLYVCVLYWTLVPSLGHFLAELIGHKWPITLSKLVGFLLACGALIRLYRVTSPVLMEASTALSGQIVTATEMALLLKCANCGVQNEKGNKYCRSCGAELSVAIPGSIALGGGRKCNSCGILSAPGSRFCHSCGNPLIPK